MNNYITDILSTPKQSSKKIEITHRAIYQVIVTKVHINEWKDVKDSILSLVDFDNNEYHKDKLISFTDYKNCENQSYVDDMIPILRPYLKRLNEILPYKFSDITGMWCQKYKANDFHPPHEHGNQGYSCVLYAKFDPKHHDATVFLPPFPDEYGSTYIKHIDNVVEGDLFIFPSNIIHMSMPHKSDVDRIIISFNLK